MALNCHLKAIVVVVGVETLDLGLTISKNVFFYCSDKSNCQVYIQTSAAIKCRLFVN